MQLANVRLLALTLKRFFNTVKSRPVSVNRTIRIVHEYQNLFRISEWKTVTSNIAMHALGRRIFLTIPKGEIWVVEYMQASRTVGTVAEFDGFYYQAKGASDQYVLAPHTAASIIRARRGVDYGNNWWLFPGDMLFANVSTEAAAELGSAYLLRRVLRVGDDY